MKKLVLTSIIFAAAVLATKAGGILADDFNSYNDGDIVGNVGSSWYYNSGATPLCVSNHELLVTSDRAEDAYRLLDGQPYLTNSGARLYSSYKLICSNLPTAMGTYFSHFGGTNAYSTAPISGHRCRVLAATTNSAAGNNDTSGHFYLYIVNSVGSATNGNGNQWTTALATNTVYTVVTRYVVSNASSTIWINPTNESDTHVTDPTVVPYDGWGTGANGPTNGPINIEAYDFRQATGEGTMWIDDLKVGTLFVDVAGTNTSPTINGLTDQAIPMNGTSGPQAFTVSDAETPASTLTVTASSSNTNLVPNTTNNLVLGGAGTDRTITVIPTNNQQGRATITVTVSDGQNQSSQAFGLTVGAPSISAIADQMATTNTSVPAVSFTVIDPESDPLTLWTSSSNTNLLTTNNISFGGSGSNRTVTLAPQAGQLGVTYITVYVTDGHNTNSSAFSLTMRPLLGLVWSEDFAYTGFDVGYDNALYDATGGSGGPWYHVSPSGTAFHQVQVTNGWAYMVATNDEDLGADIHGPYDGTNGVVLYTGFPVRFSWLPSTAGSYFLHLKKSYGETLDFHGKIFAARGSAPSGLFHLGVSHYAASMMAEFPLDLSLTNTYYVVLRLNTGTGETVLWVDPVAETSQSVVATDNPQSSTIGGIALREDSGIGDMAVGPIKIGTSFSDVFTAPSRITLHAALDGSGNLVLTWSNELFLLAWADDVAGPYTVIPGATSGFIWPVPPNSVAQFFRLVYP